MAMAPIPKTVIDDTFGVPPELLPNYDDIITEDGAPVDSIYSERQMRLLTEPLYSSWAGPGEGRPFLALANVGVFYKVRHPPLVPDVLVSLDVDHPQDQREKRNRSYFVWEFGKAPDVVVEVVSNDVGGETGHKLGEYAFMGVRYYAVWDPLGYIQRRPLSLYVLRGKSYAPLKGDWLAEVGLGLRTWHGKYEEIEATWLRWYDAEGNLIPTGTERAEQERERADRAEQRLARLEAKLRSLGLDPNADNGAN